MDAPVSVPIDEDEVSEEIVILFPTPLPPLNLAPEIEETGFTGPEQVAIRNAMRVLARQEHYHARQIFLNFYTQHEHILQRYRCGENRFYLKKLNQHTFWLLNSYKHIVNEGLDNAVIFNIYFTEIATRHRNQNFTNKDVTLLAQNLQNYILNVLKDVSSPTLVNSVSKLCKFLIVYQYGEDYNYIKYNRLTMEEQYDENEDEDDINRRRELRESLFTLQTEIDDIA